MRFGGERGERPPITTEVARALRASPRRMRDVISPFLHGIPPQVEQAPIKLLYEDMLANNKRAGVPVSPPPHRLRGGSVLSRLLAHVRPSPSSFVPAPVHRLDLNTSGCLIFAKDAEAASALMAQFEARPVEKEYAVLSSTSPLHHAPYRMHVARASP